MLNDLRSKDGAASKGYLRTAPAAAYLDVGQSTLERMRIAGTGPVFRVLGSRIVVYAIQDLDAFASQNIRTSTAQTA